MALPGYPAPLLILFAAQSKAVLRRDQVGSLDGEMLLNPVMVGLPLVFKDCDSHSIDLYCGMSK